MNLQKSYRRSSIARASKWVCLIAMIHTLPSVDASAAFGWGRTEAGSKIDSNRKASPLVIPEDAVVVDSSYMTAEEVVGEVLREIRART